MPSSEWDKCKVHKVVKERLEELHLLGISHNDIRLDNIHVSISGRITLIDFGLAVYPANDERKQIDFEALDELVPITGYGISGKDKIHDVVSAKNKNKESEWE